MTVRMTAAAVADPIAGVRGFGWRKARASRSWFSVWCSLVEARQPVLRDRLPSGGVGDEHARVRPDARVTVESRHTDHPDLAGPLVASEEVRAAQPAERLRERRSRRPVAQVFCAGKNRDGAGGDLRRALKTGAGSLLTTSAVAVDRPKWSLRDREADCAAAAATGQGVRHAQSLSEPRRTHPPARPR